MIGRAICCMDGRIRSFISGGMVKARSVLRGESGQGTTEYAILVGVIVVIAILAVTLFRDKLQELWSAIAEGINSL